MAHERDTPPPAPGVYVPEMPGRGRPPLDPTKVFSEVVTTKLTPAQMRALESEAKEKDVTVARALRERAFPSGPAPAPLAGAAAPPATAEALSAQALEAARAEGAAAAARRAPRKAGRRGPVRTKGGR